MTITTLSAESLDSIVGLALELWPGVDYGEEYQAFEQLLQSADDYCCLCRVADEYIAFIHAGIRNDYVEGATTEPVAYVEALYVRPGFQQQGVGKMLLTAVETWARQKNCKQLASDTESNNTRAIGFHLHTGFKEVNRLVCFIKDLGGAV